MPTPDTSPGTPPLGTEGRRIADELIAEYGRTTEVAQLAHLAGLAWERAEAARAVLAAEGLLLHVGNATYQHPAVRMEAEALRNYLAAVKVLRQPVRRVKLGRPAMGERRVVAMPRPAPSRASKYITAR